MRLTLPRRSGGEQAVRPSQQAMPGLRHRPAHRRDRVRGLL